MDQDIEDTVEHLPQIPCIPPTVWPIGASGDCLEIHATRNHDSIIEIGLMFDEFAHIEITLNTDQASAIAYDLIGRVARIRSS